MKNIALVTGAAFLLAVPLFSKTLNLTSGDVSYLFQLKESDRFTVDNGSSPALLNVEGFSFPLDNTSLSVNDHSVADNVVEIEYTNNSAKVFISGNVASYVNASVDGAHVVITQSDNVSESTCGEITYSLKGESDNGSFTIVGSYKTGIDLNGVFLHNPAGPALDIQNGKRIALSAKSGTENSLSDGERGSWKGTIVCKGHLEFKGKGDLTVTGNTAHAVFAKEYVEIKNLDLRIDKSVKDGINCTQYFLMSSGSLNMSNVGDDGIQIDYKDAENRDEEDTGSGRIVGGKIDISTTANAAKGIKCEGDLVIEGGELNISASGNGIWDSGKSKTKASACLSADGALTISNGTLDMIATGSGGKGTSCDGDLTILGGEINIRTEGGVYAYLNNQEYHNYTGNTDRLNSDQKSSPKGMKADGDVVISGGNVKVVCTGSGGEGIESKKTMTINGGTIYAITADDALNCSSTMTVNDGDITVISSGNDGLDSNGDMHINGGKIRAFGAGAPECGIDVNSEQGYKLYIKGGDIIAVGGNNSTPSNSQSTQPYVSVSLSVSKNQTVTVMNGNEEIVSFVIPEDYNGSSNSGPGGWWAPPRMPKGGEMFDILPMPPMGEPAFAPGGGSGGSRGGGVLISSPKMVNGTSYTVTNGSTSVTGSAVLYGSASPW